MSFLTLRHCEFEPSCRGSSFPRLSALAQPYTTPSRPISLLDTISQPAQIYSPSIYIPILDILLDLFPFQTCSPSRPTPLLDILLDLFPFQTHFPSRYIPLLDILLNIFPFQTYSPSKSIPLLDIFAKINSPSKSIPLLNFLHFYTCFSPYASILLLDIFFTPFSLCTFSKTYSFLRSYIHENIFMNPDRQLHLPKFCWDVKMRHCYSEGYLPSRLHHSCLCNSQVVSSVAFMA